ncbi:MAG: pentapeptide repeat-containing protein [Candidatus Electrothrix sp. GM3_4]|nr:pentapeptide repeat-containing protein [Candidatus Electrothrix sp. GM3_4]
MYQREWQLESTWKRIMKKNKYMYLCACLLLCGTAASAESLGSSNDGIQKNFNRLVTTKECPGCDLRGAVLTRMDLREADLQGADLSEAKLNLTNFSKANLQNTILRGAALGGADFSGADLRGADLTDAQLAGAYLKEALLDQEITPEKPYEPEALPETSVQPSVQERINPEESSAVLAQLEQPVKTAQKSREKKRKR